ncbi:sensor histidine kinase [Terrilactibacillus laevilacticus]|uniref:sensor histidine kinase n=1 Tax=Terrilactibacillus laevilacticus TaxID=1380157 RepID=UPI001146552F|nr:HAMP domain-containing sensor histidine kinase [Terrilactibacillus laevilacticus]
MKFRTMLLLSYGVGLLAVTIFLGFSYSQMIFDKKMVFNAIIITLISSICSFAVNYLFLRPVIRSVGKLSKQSRDIASGRFDRRVSASQPLEVKRLAEDFNEMAIQVGSMIEKIQLEEKTRNDLIANLSHDIKTPLASLQSYSEALIDGMVKDEKEVSDYLSTIRRETMRLTYLVEELLQVAALDRKEWKINPEKVWTDQLLIEALQTFDIQLKNENREIIVSITPDCKSIWIDRESILRILFNLLANALKFSPKGTPLTIGVSRQKNRVQFVVQDQGIGISEEEQAKIFDRLYRVEKSRNLLHGGSGLGLAIAKELVEQLGGSITVESVLNEGSRFIVTVPEVIPQ